MAGKQLTSNKNKTCSHCWTTFKRCRELEHHLKKREKYACGSHCDRQFCNFDQLRQHKNSVQQEKDGEVDYDVSIAEMTGYEEDPKLLDLIIAHEGEINDNIESFADYIVVNKKVTFELTYRDLQELLTDIYIYKGEVLLQIEYGRWLRTR